MLGVSALAPRKFSQVSTTAEDEEGGVKTQGPEVTRRGALDCQVCVPAAYSDAQVLSFANMANCCGTENGWAIRRQGDRKLAGKDERVKCAGRDGFVHIMLDA